MPEPSAMLFFQCHTLMHMNYFNYDDSHDDSKEIVRGPLITWTIFQTKVEKSELWPIQVYGSFSYCKSNSADLACCFSSIEILEEIYPYFWIILR